eukprot:TRINITY_DN15140_c0_g1_i1.p1 TRINITY_DN15140_c0_g1~~TRINITY_DN15140_c0_g1_i1.p1  ORF type:complete len:125 (+),score=15.06 TRINITY_DN15140_c0_g1_i1:121-495(+)
MTLIATTLLISTTSVDNTKLFYSSIMNWSAFSFTQTSSATRQKISWYGLVGHLFEDLPQAVIQLSLLATGHSGVPIEVAVISLIFTILGLATGIIKKCIDRKFYNEVETRTLRSKSASLQLVQT